MTDGPGAAPVPETARQASAVRARWAWAEPSVWTERMLTALEQGVKGGKWFSLIDTPTSGPSARSTVGFACACAASYADVRSAEAAAGAGTIGAGRMPTLPSMGCSPSRQPMSRPVSPRCGEPPTGEPCAGEPHARFGGRGSRDNRLFLPLCARASVPGQSGASPLQACALRPVPDCNCVVARRGGEQQEGNDQSVG